MTNIDRSVTTAKQLRRARAKITRKLLSKSKPVKAASPVHINNPRGFRSVFPIGPNGR